MNGYLVESFGYFRCAQIADCNNLDDKLSCFKLFIIVAETRLTIYLLAVAAVPAEAVCCCCVRVYVGVYVSEVC